jgi:CheY-like chemotaxis protein
MSTKSEVGSQQLDQNHDEQARAAAVQAADLARSQLLAGMSHELRTPVSAILGMIELALGQRLPPIAKDCLVTAKSSADSLLMLLDDALDLSRIQAGSFELDLTTFDLRRVLDRALKPVAQKAARNGLALQVSIPADVPGHVVGDPLRMRQVLTNLVGNAIAHTEAGRVELRAAVVERTGTQVLLELTVSDTGPGVPEEDRERIFDAFTEVDASITRLRGGPGIGLSISRRLAEQMGGRLWVESGPGAGSTFHFTSRLDVVASDEPEQDAVAAGPLTPLPEAALRALRVLVVDDTPASRKISQFILHRRGHRTEVASDGRQALELVRRFPFDVVLMDVHMPFMDGLKAAEAIRALDERARARVPIIAMSAHAHGSDEERCRAAGVDAYLSKPIDGVKLVQLVERFGNREARGGSAGATPPVAPAREAGREGDRRHDPSRGGGPEGARTACRGGLDHEPPFNLGDAIGKCFGRESVFRDMVTCCFDESHVAVAEMRSRIAAGGAGAGDQLAAAARRLKGTLVYLAAPRVLETIRRVEQIGQSGDLTQANTTVDVLERQLSHLMEALAPYRTRPD